MTDPIRAVAAIPDLSQSIPHPARWADLRSAAEARALSATGDQPARSVTFAPGSGWIRA